MLQVPKLPQCNDHCLSHCRLSTMMMWYPSPVLACPRINLPQYPFWPSLFLPLLGSSANATFSNSGRRLPLVREPILPGSSATLVSFPAQICNNVLDRSSKFKHTFPFFILRIFSRSLHEVVSNLVPSRHR